MQRDARLTRTPPILVVDDDVDIRRALTRILEHEGHEVVTACDGPSAVAMTREHRPSLVVLDYMMPGMDGSMVLEALREEMKDEAPPAVLLTAVDGTELPPQGVGAAETLHKPFRLRDLLRAVERHRRDTVSERN